MFLQKLAEFGWFTDATENEPHRENDLCLFSSAGPSFGLSVTRSRQDDVLAAFPENCRPIAARECILDMVSGWCI